MGERIDTLAVAGVRIAVRRDGPEPDGRTCGLFWLGGFKSDMAGTKAEAIARFARERRRPCTRFDYSGHGRSEGRFEDGTLTAWLEEAAAVFRGCAAGPRIVIGSSMGGYLALRLVERLHEAAPAEARRIRALVLIAPAADMTEALMWQVYPEEIRRTILEHGVWQRPSSYGDGPYPITRALIEDGRRHLLLDRGLEVPCPVRILHGEEDPDVPWRHGLALYRSLRGEDVTFTLVKGGDHRLSGPRDLADLVATVDGLCRSADG